MTRKDTILIAVVINAGLLAILFTTAVIYDTGKGIEQTEFIVPLVDNHQAEVPSSLIAAASTGDEVDNVLKYYNPPVSNPVNDYRQDPLAFQNNLEEEETSTTEGELLAGEVKVKKGDVLEKIARANKTTIEAIKKANHLNSERLYIGQVLKMPAKTASSLASAPSSEKREKEVEPTESIYYIIKSGDNPWKIAKQYNVNYEDIVRLNNLNEEKAKNLKIGDRIRVK